MSKRIKHKGGEDLFRLVCIYLKEAFTQYRFKYQIQYIYIRTYTCRPLLDKHFIAFLCNNVLRMKQKKIFSIFVVYLYFILLLILQPVISMEGEDTFCLSFC